MIEMGAECENVIALATNALFEGDTEAYVKVKQEGQRIDELEREIETICLRLILQQQPVAKDLRIISAALKMITDMERIGDQAEDIAGIVATLNGRVGDECIYISVMAEATIKMVTGSIDAYVNEDLELAKAVLKHDDLVDETFIRAKEKLINMIAEDVSDGEYALDLLMIAKYFERIGDHATNIAEWVIFSVTGYHQGG